MKKLNAQMREKIQDEYAAYTAKLLHQAHIPGKPALSPTDEPTSETNEEQRLVEGKPDEVVEPTAVKTDHLTKAETNGPTTTARVTPDEDKSDNAEDSNNSPSLTDSSADKQNEANPKTTMVEVEDDRPIDQYFGDPN
ncbi:hypothetical protein ACI3E1_07150 [Ligilactobacillus sp. LYQ139]|uniref:hypothetical protein n=1 Tax=Ligilactobacillus sp. LYQ139 TaxID=3378800 RepID=UPI0038535D5D